MELFANKKKTITFIVIAALCLLLTVGIAVTVWLLNDYFERTEPPVRDVFIYDDYEYVILPDNTVEIVKYRGSDMKIDVPAVIDGMLVTSIGDYAFFESLMQEVYTGSFVERIGEHAFASSGSLSKVTLSPNLKSIGKYAFRLCQSIEEIELPAGLTSIGDGAFYGTYISEIAIPQSVTEIKRYTFYGCARLKSFVAPPTVTSVGEYAFYDCLALEDVTLAGVRSIGGSAFGACTALTKVTLGRDISEISDGAFQYCSKLSDIHVPEGASGFEVVDKLLINKATSTAFLLPMNSGVVEAVIPDYVRHIAPRAFSSVETLRSVILPDGLLTVGEGAFNGAKLLARVARTSTPSDVSLDIPDSVTDIGGYAFSGCHIFSQLTDEFTIVGDGILIKYVAPTDAYGTWIGTAHTEVIREDRVENGVTILGVPVGVSVTIPEGVKKISTAFANTNAVIRIKAPSTLTYVSAGAFSYAAYLESVDFIGSGVTVIGDRAFEACQSLKEVKLPTSLISIGDYAFFSCYALTNITIPDSVKGISDYMFADCTSLKEISIGNGVETIGVRAFHNCGKLAVITLPKTVKLIKEYAFSQCGLVDFILEAGVTAEGYILYNCVRLRNLTVKGSGVTPIGIAFGCTALDKVVIDGDFYRIGDESFYDCKLLKNVIIPDSVVEVGDEAFAHCSSLKLIHFGGDLTYVGAYAFNLCKKLQGFEFDRTLTAIGDYAFAGCEGFTVVDLRWVTTLGEHCFENCFNIKSVDLRSVAYEIPEGAFSSCTSLEHIRFADTLTEIGTAAFLSNTSLKSVKLPVSLIQVGENAFMSCKNLVNIVFNDKLEIIDHGSFYETGLVDVSVPESVWMIGDAAFASCPALRTFKMTDNVTYLGEAAFMLSSLLYDVRLSAALDTIAIEAFAYTSLVSVAIPEGVRTIDEAAFANCSYLARVDLAQSVRTIGDSAFANCKSITIVSYYGKPILIGGIEVGKGNEYFLAGLLEN